MGVMEGIPTSFEDLEVSRYGLDEGDILQIRERLALTPTERLLVAQEIWNTAQRIRSKNE